VERRRAGELLRGSSTGVTVTLVAAAPREERDGDTGEGGER
jgi:hypothetical protein